MSYLTFPLLQSVSTTLRTLPTFAARKRYCDANFTRLAAGSGRIVYALDDCRVLKLAKNIKGVAQNTVESDYALHDMYDNIVTRVFDLDEDARWLVAERATKTTKKRFRNIVGLDFDVAFAYIAQRHYERTKPRFWLAPTPSLTPEQKVVLTALTDDHFFAGGLVGLMTDFDMPYGDFRRLSSYGEVCRDGQVQVVLSDYGLTEDVYASHYKR